MVVLKGITYTKSVCHLFPFLSSGCQIGRRGSFKRKMLVSWLQWLHQRSLLLSKCIPVFRLYILIPPQTSSAGLSSFRTLRCPQCPPPSKYPGTATSSWQQVEWDLLLLSAKMKVVEILGTEKASWFTSPLFFFLFFLGTYKPRIRCYDTHQLSLKFERCLDSDGKSEIPIFFYIVYDSLI